MRGGGFTLLELLAVVLVVGIVSSVVLIDRGPAEAERRLTVGATEVADALRFARAEALHSGELHGAVITSADSRVRLFRLDLSGSPPVQLFVVNHPIDKRPYDLSLSTAPFSGGVTIASSSFTFDAGPTGEGVVFDPSGAPVSPISLRRLLVGQVVVQYAGRARTIAVAPITGRVTVQ